QLRKAGLSMQRIVVIDDDRAVRDVLVRILVRAGYEVVSAEDGHDGILSCREQMPALIVTDIVMPTQDGIATIIELRQFAPSIPIIAISGGGRAMQFLDAAQKIGADRVLLKPIKPADLLTAISDLLHGTRDRQDARQA